MEKSMEEIVEILRGLRTVTKIRLLGLIIMMIHI